MAEFEEKLNAILSDPKAMGQIMSIAKVLNMAGDEEGQDKTSGGSAASYPDDTPPPDFSQVSAPFGDIDPKLVQAALRIFTEYSATDDRKTALLSALQPFLKEERYAKVDKAVQITKLSRIARVAFQLLKGGGENV